MSMPAEDHNLRVHRCFPSSPLRMTPPWHIPAGTAIGPLARRDTLNGMETPGSAPSVRAVPDETRPDVPGTDAAETDAAKAASGPVWRFLVAPRWLGWHLLVILAFWGMLWLGDWQFHRAMEGNGLSWAYTFEWPLFSGFAIVFWARTIRDEFRARRGIDIVVDYAPPGQNLPGGIGMQQVNELAYDDTDDEDLASYNAYLAKLSGKTKALSAGRKAVTRDPGRKAITHG